MALQSSTSQQPLEDTLRMGQSVNTSTLSMSAPSISIRRYRLCDLTILQLNSGHIRTFAVNAVYRLPQRIIKLTLTRRSGPRGYIVNSRRLIGSYKIQLIRKIGECCSKMMAKHQGSNQKGELGIMRLDTPKIGGTPSR